MNNHALKFYGFKQIEWGALPPRVQQELLEHYKLARDKRKHKHRCPICRKR